MNWDKSNQGRNEPTYLEYDDNDPLSAARGVTTVIVWAIWACAGGLVGLLIWRQVHALGWL